MSISTNLKVPRSSLSSDRKNRIDIYDIPIVQITDQYIAYLDGQKSLDMEIASEFLLMAATLIH